MSTPVEQVPAGRRTSKLEREDAIAWAAQYVDVDHSKTITDTPWATTLRLRSEDSVYYLKILPPTLAGSPAISKHLTARFSAHVPAVIACDTERGLLLQRACSGRDLSRDASEADRIKLLSVYARIQSDCRDDATLRGLAPAVEVAHLVDQLLDFLSPDKTSGIDSELQVAAKHYFSSSRCGQYHALLEARAPLLNLYLQSASSLPSTINHGDLRTANAAKSADGDVMLYDWDEAVIAPAGFSLHALFSGCSSLLQIQSPHLSLVDPEELRQARREFAAYRDVLKSTGYAPAADIDNAVCASAVAGMIHYIISFGRFPSQKPSLVETVRRNLSRRLSDLLDVCDLLALSSGNSVVELADNYQLQNKHSRAERLLYSQSKLRPTDKAALNALGNIRLERNRVSRAARAFNASLDLDKDDAVAHAGLAQVRTFQGYYRSALRHLAQSMAASPDTEKQGQLDRIVELERMQQYAARPGTVPTVYFSAMEKTTGVLSPATLALCNQLFRQYGVLLMKEVFPPSLLNECRRDFTVRYQSYMSDKRHDDALRIGDKRFQVTIDMVEPYSSPVLYGNGLIIPLMRKLVGTKCILGCYTSAVSLPGSQDQRMHKDHTALFYDDPDAGTIPSYAVTMMVPLVDMDERVGTTRIKKGSHRKTSTGSRNLPTQTPLTQLGDCYLMDYRVSHHGQANQSTNPRPVLSLVYQRPWFRDYINFHNQPSLRLSAEELNKVPDELRSLLAWTAEPGPREGQK